MDQRFDFRHSGLLARIAEAFHDWRARAQQWREFNVLAQSGALDDVLAEAGVSRAELPAVIQAYPQSGRRHVAMMRWMGVDPAALPHTPETREAQWHCIHCAASRACDHWLALPTDRRPFPRFCPNVEVFRRARAPEATHVTHAN